MIKVGDSVRFKTLAEMVAEYGATYYVPGNFTVDMYVFAGEPCTVTLVGPDRCWVDIPATRERYIHRQMLTTIKPGDDALRLFKKRCVKTNDLLASSKFGCQTSRVKILCDILMGQVHGR